MSDTIQIQEYNFLDYSLKLQEAVKNGYCIGDSVDGCPMIVGFSYTATLYKQDAPVVDELVLKVSVDTTVLQEQLKQGGDIEQAIEDSFVVHETSIEETQLELPLESPVVSVKPPTKGRKRT